MRGYKAYNYHPCFLESSGALFSHIPKNLAVGFDP